jgi:hypothetical protein
MILTGKQKGWDYYSSGADDEARAARMRVSLCGRFALLRKCSCGGWYVRHARTPPAGACMETRGRGAMKAAAGFRACC